MRSAALLFAALFAAILAPSPFAQEPPSAFGEGVSLETSAADKDWQAAVESIRPAATAEKAGESNATARNSGSQRLAQADRFKEYYTKHPGHPLAIDARRLEAELLIDAVAQGATEVTDRTTATVLALRKDAAVPVETRSIVAATHEFVAARQRIHDEVDLQREYEAVARGLISEFPDQPQGYVSLLTLAMQREDELARAMVEEVVNAESAPAPARAQGKILRARLDLIGTSVDELLNERDSKNGKAGLRPGRPTVVYFWATWSPASLELADLVRALGARSTVVAVCLDTDVTSAEQVAAARSLPGIKIFLRGGLDGEEALRFGASEIPLVYLADDDGRIVDVRGMERLEAKLTQWGGHAK